ncbi:DnaD and phage-associated domain-containing protein [Lachnospiraceae bacterium C10]|nr:DnaD and phage-associated domain-containing protein [Lachnospiraceae bacterium C10]
MADIHLHMETGHQVTCVSNFFIDHYMKDAPGEYVKIYLYLLRTLSDPERVFAISAMAAALEHTARDIRLALQYWEDAGLLSLTYDREGELCDICLLHPESSPESVHQEKRISSRDVLHPVESEPTVAKAKPAKPAAAEPVNTPEPASERTMRAYSAQELLSFQEDDEVRSILFIAERYLGHTLSSTDLNYILFWYDELHMDEDMIDFLITDCLQSGKNSLKYMNSICLSWAEHGITTLEAAKADRQNHSHNASLVRQSYGISGRGLSPVELSFVHKWFNTYSFSDELVKEAINRTMMNIGQVNFKYTDKIMEQWHNAGIVDAEGVAAYDQKHNDEIKERFTKVKAPKTSDRSKDSFHNFSSQVEYDMDDIEARLLKKQL